MTALTNTTIYACKYPARHRLRHYQNAVQHPRLAAISFLPVNTLQDSTYHLAFSYLISRNSSLLGRGTLLLGKQSLPLWEDS